MMKRFWRPETGIFLATWLVLMVGGRSRFFQDPGTFWHTVVGEQMLDSGTLIRTDSFSFTFAGQPWIAHQWLGECLMALVHRLGGLDALLLATVTALAALYTWVAHRLIRAGLHWSLAALVAGLALAASSSHFHVRPHVATMLFLGCTYALLCDFEAGRGGAGRLLWLVPLFALWTNIHGGMLGGLCTLGLAAAGWTFYRLIGRPSPVTGIRQVGWLGLLIAACGLTGFVNPYGPVLPRTWLEIMHADLPQIIQEHAPLSLARPEGWMVLLLALFYAFMLLGVLPRWPRVTWLLPLVWFYLTLGRVRHAPLFSVTAGLALADMLPYTRWAAWLARPGSDLFQFPKEEPADSGSRLDWRPALAPVLVVVAAVLLQAGRVAVPVLGSGWAQLDPAYWPVELLPDLERCQVSRSPGGTPIFNEYLDGGFLIYHTPGFKVFVDDRCELYGDRWLEDFVAAQEGHDTAGHVRRWERQYGSFDFALTRTGSGFDRYFAGAEDWTLVRRTETATLYRRRR